MLLAAALHCEARAELAEAEQGLSSPSPEEDCTVYADYPIIGMVSARLGRILSVEHPWTDAMGDVLEARGIMIRWEWCFDAHRIISGDARGPLVYIYVGTREHGPRAQWHDGHWYKLTSNSKYGGRWALGGTWRTEYAGRDRKGYNTLAECAPDLDAAIKEVQGMSETKNETKEQRIAAAKAKLAAANKRVLAASQREMARGYLRQASNPAYDGQADICIGKADQVEAMAARSEAEADVIEAEA
jgi:hypothetical protein